MYNCKSVFASPKYSEGFPFRLAVPLFGCCKGTTCMSDQCLSSVCGSTCERMEAKPTGLASTEISDSFSGSE